MTDCEQQFSMDQEKVHKKKMIITRLAAIPCAGIVLAALSGMFSATGFLIIKLIKEIHPIEIVVTR